MTEYDFSPEAYERYLATQVRIANWVDKTEQHRSQFEHAIQPSPPRSRSPSPPARPTQPGSHHHKLKRPHHSQQPRQLYIHPPSPASESSDDYGDGPGPMRLASPGIVYPQQHQYPAPYQQQLAPMPMMPHAPMVMPQTYMTAPHHKSSSHHRRRSPHSRSHSHSVPGYYGVPSPPVSPGYQYGYPQMMGGAHPGYMLMQPQQPRAMPYMSSDLPPPPRSAPANVTGFTLPTSPGVSQGSNSGGDGSYFQANVPAHTSQSAAYPPPMLPGVDSWSYGVASPSHSAMSASTETGAFAVIMTTPSPTHPQQTHYFANIPQYQGIHSAMASASAPYLGLRPNDSGPSYPNDLLYVPPTLQGNAYDYAHGRSKQHYLRRSIG